MKPVRMLPERFGAILRVPMNDRTCVICGVALADSESGNWFADTKLLAHKGLCTEKLALAYMDFSRSTRGRWRSRAEVKRLVRHWYSLDINNSGR
jgi:hypothetical protein